MAAFASDLELVIRISAFAGIFAAMALWEVLAPRRPQAVPRAVRWPNNIALIVLNAAFLRFAMPVTAVAAALYATENGWGLLALLPGPAWLHVAAAVVLLDLAIYLQHVAFHAAPVLWRLHRMHHADLEFDVTTGTRFHPIEMLLSMVIKIAVIAALGAPALAVLIFEVLLNGTSMFNHGNVRMPRALDRVIRRVLVTPDMHRVHHSIAPRETNSNFGFNLSCWDRLFGTYRAQPAEGHDGMTIGLPTFRERQDLRLDRMLVQPFRGPAGAHPVKRGPAA